MSRGTGGPKWEIKDEHDDLSSYFSKYFNNIINHERQEDKQKLIKKSIKKIQESFGYVCKEQDKKEVLKKIQDIFKIKFDEFNDTQKYTLSITHKKRSLGYTSK